MLLVVELKFTTNPDMHSMNIPLFILHSAAIFTLIAIKDL